MTQHQPDSTFPSFQLQNQIV